MDPAVVVDAPGALPQSSGDLEITGRADGLSGRGVDRRSSRIGGKKAAAPGSATGKARPQFAGRNAVVPPVILCHIRCSL